MAMRTMTRSNKQWHDGTKWNGWWVISKYELCDVNPALTHKQEKMSLKWARETIMVCGQFDESDILNKLKIYNGQSVWCWNFI